MRTRAVLIISSLVATTTTMLAWRFSYLVRIPAVGLLVAKEGAPGKIALGMLTAVLCVMIALVFRLSHLRKEEVVVIEAGRFVSSISEQTIEHVRRVGAPLNVANALAASLQNSSTPGARLALAALENSELRQRLELVGRRLSDCDGGERSAFFLSGYSSLSLSQTQRLYVALKAITWAMPGLGFIATTLEMARAIAGMGAAIGGTVHYEELRGLLVSGVVPHLAGAFDVTVMGLAASIICFLSVSVIGLYDESVGTAADMTCLKLLALVTTRPSLPSVVPVAAESVRPEDMALAVAGAVEPLRREVENWTTAIHDVRMAVSRLLGVQAAP